jgi:hypothetical protein
MPRCVLDGFHLCVVNNNKAEYKTHAIRFLLWLSYNLVSRMRVTFEARLKMVARAC